jgi:hypothetical protein
MLVACFLGAEAWVQSKTAHAGCVDQSDTVTATSYMTDLAAA